jgi:hypothetical protein
MGRIALVNVFMLTHFNSCLSNASDTKRKMNQHIVVNKRGAERVRRAGHLWIYRSDITSADGVPAGAIVRAVSGDVPP